MSKHVSRLVAALVLALVGSLATSAGAMASSIDPGRTGSLTIYKYEVTEGMDIDSARPAKEVTFTIARVVSVDLTTGAGWEQASAIAAGEADAGALGDARSEPTDADGISAFPGLDLGLYLVTETGYRDGVTPVDPFYVTIPMTDPELRDRWIYDVTVFPKNSVPPGPCDYVPMLTALTDDESGALPDDAWALVAQYAEECNWAVPTPPPTPTPSPSPSPSAAPSSGDGADGGAGRGGSTSANSGTNAAVTPLKPGITGAETGMYTAIAMGLVAVGACLGLVVARVRRREDA